MKARTLSLLLTTLCLCLPAAAQDSPQPQPSREYRSVHGDVPKWLEARFEKAIEIVKAGKLAPAASSSEVRAFLIETFEHINEVNSLVEKMGGKARPLPKHLESSLELKGVHDFGEYSSTRRVREFLDAAKKNPLIDFKTREPVPAPKWLETLVLNAEASGQRKIDVGKLAPWVAAGLARNGAADIYSIKLHNLSAHHSDFSKKTKVSNSLIEAIADRVNAMRQVRIYRAEPMPFETIKRFLLEDVTRGSLPKVAEGLVKKAIESQRALERSGRVNPYFMKESGQGFPRLSNGAINWKKFSADQAKKQGAGLAHFTLAMFLKELAVVMKTGDRLRIEEFFEGLVSTDFFIDYGLFAAGAQGGQVAYQKYLARHIKPRFVSGVLQTNLVLAAGLALPELVRGRFNAKTFAIDVASLGLSSTAVKAGLEGLSRVWALERFQLSGKVVKRLHSLKRLASAGAWLYTVAETAVVLYFGEQISASIHKFIDDKAAREAVGAATQQFFEALGSSQPNLEKAIEDFEKVHDDYRNHLYKPLIAAEQLYLHRLNKVAEKAKKEEEKRYNLRKHIDSLPQLKHRITAKHGSVAAYLAETKTKADRDIDGKVKEIMQAFQKARVGHLAEIYEGGKRAEPYLQGSTVLWEAKGAVVGDQGDPYTGRQDFFARRGRATSFIADNSEEISKNRLQSYDDLTSALKLALKSHPQHAVILNKALQRTRHLKSFDQRLIGTESAGATKALGKAMKKG
jgi:hypothetical protein